MKIRRFALLLAVAGAMCAQKVDYIKQLQNKPQLDSREYVWSRANGSSVSGGNLVAGSPSTVTLNQCPPGLVAGRSIYISGVGTPEAVTLSGGSCTTGATASGSLSFTPANAHAGAWVIGTATAGIQEALGVAPATGATIYIPTGIVTLNAAVIVSLEGAHITCATRNNAAGYIIRTSGHLFDVSAGSVEIEGCALRGGAHDGIAAPSGNIGIVTTGVRGHFHDLMIDLIYGGIQNNGGFHTKITNIWGRNCTGYLIKHSDGVSPFIDTVTYATDAPYEVPSEAGIVINASGAYMYNLDILAARNGILVEPTTALVEWTFIYDARMDQNFHAGVLLRNNGIHAIKGVFMHDLWSASTGVGFVDGLTSGGVHAGIDDGVGVIIGEGSGSITEVQINGGQIHNNRTQNIKVIGNTDFVKLSNLRLLATNLGDYADVDNVYVGTIGRVEISENEIRGAAPGKTDLRSGILAAPVVVDLHIWNNQFNGTWAGGDPIRDLSSGGHIQNFGFNRGVDDTPKTIASATNITLPPTQYISLTGSTPIANISPVYQGKKLYLYKGDVGTVDFNTSGNIQSPTGTPGVIFSLSQGQNATCEYTGAGAGGRWICHK